MSLSAVSFSGGAGPEAARIPRILEARNHVYERIALGAPLAEVLNILTATSEQVMPDVLCSVLLYDPETRTVHHGAAPSLPEFYCQAINGAEVGVGRGSCGTAIATAQRVVVEDVLTHPYWTNFWKLAVTAGLRACWSQPIISSKHAVLGSFAMYYRDVRKPDAFDLEFIETSAHVAAVAIERTHTEQELEQHRNHLEEMVRARTSELEKLNQELRQVNHDVSLLRGLLPICASCKRVRDDKGYWAQIEAYIVKYAGPVFTHGICPDCSQRLYPGLGRR